jgi:hypothetical protein
MIERQKLQGREATVAYLTAKFEPASKDEAELVKVTFQDNNETLWLVEQQHRRFGFNPNHDEAGRFAEGGGKDAKAGAVPASQWLSTDKAKAVIAKVFSADNIKTAVSLGLKSALYHLGNLDDPAMEVLDPFIHHHVHNIETTLAVTKGRAHDMMIAGVKKLMDARAKEKKQNA